MGNNRLAVSAIIFSAALAGAVLGFLLPLLSLRLHAAGQGSAWIGLMMSAPALGMFVAAFVAPWLGRRLGLKPLLLLAIVLGGIAFQLAIGLAASAAVFLACLLTGICTGMLVIFGESWIADNSPEDSKGRFIGLYTTAYTGSQLCGPLLIGMFGLDSLLPPALMGSLFALAALLLALASLPAAADEQAHGRLSPRLVLLVPVLFAAVFFFAFFDAAMLSMLPVYAVQHGYSERLAAMLVTVLFVGDALLQMPVGYLSDRMGSRFAHRFCGVSGGLLLLSLPWVVGTDWLWPHLALLGGAAGGIYTLALVRAGERFRGQQLVAVNAMFGITWGLASASGPLLSGTAMQYSGNNGLVLALLLCLGSFLLLLGREPRLAAQPA